MKPALLVIAGPNGSGKTTLTVRLRPFASRTACTSTTTPVDGAEARLCARTHEGLLRKVYGALPTWVERAVVGLERHAQFEDLRSST